MASMAIVHLIVVLVVCLAPSTGMGVLHADATTTNNVTSTPSYFDGQGTYVGCDNVHDRGVGHKCWSDYFVVDQGTHPGKWKKASGDVYCTGTSASQMRRMDGFSTCETWNNEDVSGEAKSKISSFSASSGYASQQCMTANDASSCSWKDQQCHCIWARPNFVYQRGYRRDRCNRGGGDRTEIMVEFYHEAPSHYDYYCGSKCTDTARG